MKLPDFDPTEDKHFTFEEEPMTQTEHHTHATRVIDLLDNLRRDVVAGIHADNIRESAELLANIDFCIGQAAIVKNETTVSVYETRGFAQI